MLAPSQTDALVSRPRNDDGYGRVLKKFLLIVSNLIIQQHSTCPRQLRMQTTVLVPRLQIKRR